MEAVNTNNHQRVETTPAAQMRRDWKSLLEKLSYKGMVRNIPFMLYIVFLCVIYIASNQRALETQKELEQQQKTLKELGWKYMDIKTKLMNAGMESHVIRNAAGLGLKPLMLPAYKVVPSEKNKAKTTTE